MQTVNGWLRSLPAGTTDASLGETVLAALGESRDGTPHVTRDEINQRLAGLLRATGTRSYTPPYAQGCWLGRRAARRSPDRAFAHEERGCARRFLVPGRRDGRRPLDAGPRALGEAVRVAFEPHRVPGTRDARPQPPGNAVGFGYKMRWLAVRDSERRCGGRRSRLA